MLAGVILLKNLAMLIANLTGLVQLARGAVSLYKEIRGEKKDDSGTEGK